MAVSDAKSAVVVPFYAAIKARAERATRAIGTNEETVTLSDGREVARQSLRVTSSDQFARSFSDDFGRYFDDANASGVPVRIAAAAWASFQEAKKSFGDNSGIAVRFGGEPGDCNTLELVYNDKPIGPFSILENRQPRSAAEIARDLQILINSSSQ
jgi:hypothetical protein